MGLWMIIVFAFKTKCVQKSYSIKKGVTLVVELKKCSTLTSVHLCHSEEKLRECIFLGKNVSISTS